MSFTPRAEKKGDSFIILLEEKGHYLQVKWEETSWAVRIVDSEGGSDNETSWATLKKSEALRTSPNAKRVREAITNISGVNSSKYIDKIIDILQEQSHLWVDPQKSQLDRVKDDRTPAQKLVDLVVESGSVVFRDQYDDEYIILNLQSIFSDASDASDAIFSTLYSDVTHTSPVVVYDKSLEGYVKTATPATLATPVKKYYRLKSNEVKEMLSLIMHHKTGEIPGMDTIKAATNLLSGYASRNQKVKLYNRLGVIDNDWYLDLTNDMDQSVKITDKGWDIVNDTPIIFKRYSHQHPLASPIKEGNALDLIDFTNFQELDDQLLYLIFVIEVLVPDIPHVIPYIYGGKGTAKSTCMVAAKATFDNSAMLVGLLNMHRDTNKMGQVLDHHYLAYFDNISHIDEDQSDLLCRAVTGAGISNRMLYSDDDDFIRQFRRCIGLNGINIAARKPDLLDRVVTLQTRQILDSERKQDSETLRSIMEKAPSILGGSLNLVVKSRQLIREGFTVADGLSRMADAMLWGAAITESLGLPKEMFLTAYRNNILDQEQNSIKSNVVGGVLLKHLEGILPAWVPRPDGGYTEPSVKSKEYKPTELHQILKKLAENEGVNVKIDFPPDATRLSSEINEFAPNLPACGFSMTRSRTGEEGRTLKFTRLIPSSLDGKTKVKSKENNWRECRNIRDFIEKYGKSPEIEPNVKLVEEKPIESQKMTLQESLEYILSLFQNNDTSLKDEYIYKNLGEKGFNTTESVKIIKTLLNDGKIFLTSPGWYKKC